VVLCHPTPGSGMFDPNPTITSTWGVHLIGLDRPGYGGSDPVGDSEPVTIERRADDIAEFLERTERVSSEVTGTDFGRVGVVGWGIGAEVAMSLAARHPRRIDRLIVVSAVAPVASEQSSPSSALECLEVSRGDTMESLIARVSELMPFGLDALGVSLDDPALGRLGELGRLGRMLREAEVQGAIGVATDLLSRHDPGWVADLDRITAETVLVYGEDDPVARAYDSAWFAKRIPHARRATVRGSGRLVISDVWQQVLQHVAPRHGGVPPEFR